MGRFQRSFLLFKESYRVLRANPQLSLFPILSGVATMVVTASFLVPLILTSPHMDQRSFTPAHYIVLAAFYFVSYFVVVFFNSALTTCAYRSFAGQPASVQDGLANAASHMPAILLWSLISATVGTILRAIGEKGGLVGQIISAIFGTAWTLVTYFVIPVMVIENQSPTTAIKQSTAYLKKTWGEQIIGGGSMGLVGLLLFLVGSIPLFGGIVALTANLIIPGIGLMLTALIYWLLVGVFMSALSGIFNTALYVYASSGEVPAGFSQQFMFEAFRPKPARKFFGR